MHKHNVTFLQFDLGLALWWVRDHNAVPLETETQRPGQPAIEPVPDGSSQAPEPEILEKSSFGNIIKLHFHVPVVPEAAIFSTKIQYDGEISGQLDWKLDQDVL